jgi:hypothetical protein
MRIIIILLPALSVSLCLTGVAEQFSFANADFQSRLQSIPVPKFQSVPDDWHNTTTGYTNEYRKEYRDLWEQIDSWPKGDMTNGLFCAVQMLSRTTCCVYIANTTTNTVAGYLHLPFEAVAEIELFNPQGKPVAKTAAGRQYGYWTQEQIKDQLKGIDPISMARKGYFGIHELLYVQISNQFSIPKAFQVEQPGEYTFHLSVRLVKSERDPSGQFLTTLLPEVVTQVEIRPEDILSSDLPTSSQTNSPAK